MLHSLKYQLELLKNFKRCATIQWPCRVRRQLSWRAPFLAEKGFCSLQNYAGLTRLWRNVPPAHYILGVHSLSLFHSNEIDHFETCAFESGGYKWKLSLYPNGNKKRNVSDHLSLYLALADVDALPAGWEINITFKFFLYNYASAKYLTFQDAEKVTTRLFPMKTEVGFDKLISLASLKDLSSGFLLDDSCIFGAEVFVIKLNGSGESISIIKDPLYNTSTWKINNFSQIAEKCIYSDEFVVGGHKWKLQLYPRGDNVSTREYISLFLLLVDDLPSDRTVLAYYNIWIGNIRVRGKYWFQGSMTGWGWTKFLSLDILNNQSEPILVNDTLTIVAEITLLSKHKAF